MPATDIPGKPPDLLSAASRDLKPIWSLSFLPCMDTIRHRSLLQAMTLIPPPLGTIPVQTSAVQEVDEYLQKHLHNGLTPILNDSEHSLEILLPFLQRALSNPFLLLPIMVRDNTPQHDKVLGQGLAQILKTRKGILIASTDLSHFYSEKEARVLDQEMLRQIQNLSPEGVLAAEQAGSGFACGAPAVAAVLWAAQELGANQVKVLHYSTSAEETGDKESVVGYGAAVVLKKHMSLGNVVLIFTLIGLNSFFVAVEFAAVTARRSRLELLTLPESRSSKIVHQWLESNSARDRLIASSQLLGITLVSLALGCGR